MSNLYSDTAWSGINFTDSPNDHLPDITFTNDDDFSTNGRYSHFGSVILSDNKELDKGQSLKIRMTESRAEKANNLGLRGRDFSQFVENAVDSVSSKTQSVKSNLTSPIDDKTISSEAEIVGGDTLLDVLKNSSNQSSIMQSKHIEVLDHLTSLFQNQNKILNEANQIQIEKNKLIEVQMLSNDAKNKALVEGFMSIAQSLEYIPTLIETITISSDRQVDIGNTANAHRMQKNVNDYVTYLHDLQDENGSTRSLGAIASHLASTSLSTSLIASHQKKQGDLAKVKKEELDELNSPEHKNMLIEAWEGLSDFVEGEVFDFDIFTYLLNNTVETEVKK